MSSYSLTEALKHSRYRLQQTSHVVHKSRSEPAGLVFEDQPPQPAPPSRRRNDEIVSVPVRPWHSPSRCRALAISSNSPPSFSVEAGAFPRQRQNHHFLYQQKQHNNCTQLLAPQLFFNESVLPDDNRSVGTELCISDTISQDPSVSDHYLCERSAYITHNCSNSTQPDGRRRQRNSRRHRAGDSGGGRNHHHHLQQQSGKGRSFFNYLPVVSDARQPWSIMGRKGKSSRGSKQPKQHDQPYAAMGATCYLTTNNVSGFFANANCLAEQHSPSQLSEQTEPEFGREDLKVRSQWHDAMSNAESTTDEHTRSAEIGSDLSALTLSRMEVSSVQVVEARSRHLKIPGAESIVETSDTGSNGQLTRGINYQQMQVDEMLSQLPQLQQPQHQQQLQQQQQQQHQQQQQQMHQQHQPHQQHHQQMQQQEPPQQQYLAANLVHTMSRNSMSQEHQQSSGRHSASTALASRQAASRGVGRCNPISHNSSKSSFSLNQSDLSSRETTTAREEVIPASDDLVHLSVISCSEAGGSEEATTAPGADTEADGEADEAESTLRAESDRLAVSVIAAEDTQPQQRLASLGPQPTHQPLSSVLSVAEPASSKAVSVVSHENTTGGTEAPEVSAPTENRRSSRFGRLKTPEICKRSFLSVLRHSIAQGHVSHRAKIKPNGALRSLAGN